VNAFWSVTMYDGQSQLLIKNPINRYLINSPMLPGMKKNSDGSLTLYIQKESPGADKEANWLPAPNGTVYLVMRLYWPKTEAPSILPADEGTWKPPGIQMLFCFAALSGRCICKRLLLAWTFLSAPLSRP
jgi:hypothetical protein